MISNTSTNDRKSSRSLKNNNKITPVDKGGDTYKDFNIYSYSCIELNNYSANYRKNMDETCK